MWQLLLLISAPFLLLLAIHSWRDVRGEKRNKKNACYSCGSSLFERPGVRAISHNKGGTYLYCGSCASRETSRLNFATVLMGAALLISIVIGLLR